MKKKPKEIPQWYFIFSKYPSDDTWHFFGEYKTKKEAEYSMKLTSEFEDVDYMVIKGNILNYEEGVPVLPYIILENSE